MKRYSVLLIIPLTCCVAFTWGATIKWTWKDRPVQQYILGGDRLEIGLRSDGVVVWREITNTTNSPSEAELVYTNLFFNQSNTNNFIIAH